MHWNGPSQAHTSSLARTGHMHSTLIRRCLGRCSRRFRTRHTNHVQRTRCTPCFHQSNQAYRRSWVRCRTQLFRFRPQLQDQTTMNMGAQQRMPEPLSANAAHHSSSSRGSSALRRAVQYQTDAVGHGSRYQYEESSALSDCCLDCQRSCGRPFCPKKFI